jgi:hypothetical protein
VNDAVRIYGLGLGTNASIAGLKGLRAPEVVDVRFTLGSLPEDGGDWNEFFVATEQEHGKPTVRVARSADGAYHRLRYADDTTIVIDSSGTALWALGPESSTIEDTATYLLGPVFGYLLRLRGVTSLHASAVVLDGRAAVFVGPSEAGKSSLAAAFAQRGAAVLGDDVVPVLERGDDFVVQPAYPRVRLWPDSARSLFAGEELPRITPHWEKRYLDLNRPGMTFAHDPVVLGGVYLLGNRLDDAVEPVIEPVTSREALVSLVRETCAARLLNRDMRAREFESLSRLVDSVPVRGLRAPANLARLPRTCAAIERDMARATAVS